MIESLSLEKRTERLYKALTDISKMKKGREMRLVAEKALEQEESYEAYFHDLLRKISRIAKNGKVFTIWKGDIKFDFYDTSVYFARNGEILGHVNYNEGGIQHIVKTCIKHNVANWLIIKLEETIKASS